MKLLELSLKADEGGLASLTVKMDGGKQWNAGVQAPTISDILDIVGACLREAGFEKWEKVELAD